MLKSELRPWNLPSLFPSPAAQLQAQVSSKAAVNKARVSPWALSLAVPSLPSVHQWRGCRSQLHCLFHQNAGVSHAGSWFSFLMPSRSFSGVPMSRFPSFLLRISRRCLCNLVLNWVWWWNLCKWSKWRAQVLPHCLILGCALWCVTLKVKVRMVHCLSQSFLLVNLCFLPPIQLKFQKPMGQTFSWSKLS